VRLRVRVAQQAHSQYSTDVLLKLLVSCAVYHLSQADRAERLEASRQTVDALETAKYDPILPLAFKIAHLFHASIEDIFPPEEQPDVAAGPPTAKVVG